VSSKKKVPDHGHYNCDIDDDTGQVRTEVKIALPATHNT